MGGDVMDAAKLFYRAWHCNVFSSGFHNGCECTPDDPHDPDSWRCGWRCGWRWKAPVLNDEQARKYGIKVD